MKVERVAGNFTFSDPEVVFPTVSGSIYKSLNRQFRILFFGIYQQKNTSHFIPPPFCVPC